MIRTLLTVLAILAAFGAGFVIKSGSGTMDAAVQQDSPADKAPLYWVAPMDPNFRRDGPGKSPMGMDLVPVYESDTATTDPAGTVRISPAVENSLGVRTALVERRPLPRTVRSVGYIGYDEDRLHHVHMRVEGWIERLGVTSAGDPVRAGQVLFDLYSPAIVNAQEELLLALRDGDRTLLRAARRKLAALGLTEAQIGDIERDRKLRQTMPFRARRGGYVSHLMVRHGMFVTPETEIMSLAQLDTVWLTVEVFEQQSARVKNGQPVEIRLAAWPDRTWNGTVDYVYPVLDPVTRTARVRIRVPNPDEALRPNMYASVHIRTEPDYRGLSIPRSALIRTGTMQKVVCALGDGRFLSVAVRAGRESGDWIEILQGLREGDRVVTSAQFLIDSESSLTAEFQRLDAVQMDTPATMNHRDHTADPQP